MLQEKCSSQTPFWKLQKKKKAKSKTYIDTLFLGIVDWFFCANNTNTIEIQYLEICSLIITNIFSCLRELAGLLSSETPRMPDTVVRASTRSPSESTQHNTRIILPLGLLMVRDQDWFQRLFWINYDQGNITAST